MTIRPYGIVINGTLELGLEAVVSEGEIVEIRPHTGMPEPFVLSAAFVNAHSHFEYRGMLGEVSCGDYWEFIRDITRRKKQQEPGAVAHDCLLAASENRSTGIGYIVEHSDRPYAAAALKAEGYAGYCTVFQELITFLERTDPDEKIARCTELASAQAIELGLDVYLTPHTPFTVDESSLRTILNRDSPLSVHVAETPFETQLFESGTGKIADFFCEHGFEPPATGTSPVSWLIDLGYGRPEVQFVHCCDVSDADIAQMAANQIAVAHCPRSNQQLGCPTSPVRRMLDAGVKVGLGLDSAASSGAIDMFAEMREAAISSINLGEPLAFETIWSMATTAGRSACSFGSATPTWDVYVGSRTPLFKLHVEGARCTEDLLTKADPTLVEWVS